MTETERDPGNVDDARAQERAWEQSDAATMTDEEMEATAADVDPDDLGSSNPYESGLTAGGTGTGIPGMTGQDDGTG